MGLPQPDQRRWPLPAPGILSQAPLINSGPRLQDLSTATFAALNAYPATSGRHPASLHALQRVFADLGHCDAPVRPGHNHSSGIIGTHLTWTSWVERWHDTPRTPRVRAIVRTMTAKAGRWLATERPEIIEPGQWTRSTCAVWVAAIDRIAVGDCTQRQDGLGDRRGNHRPRTKAHILMTSRTSFRDCQDWEWIPRHFDPTRALAVPRGDVWVKLIWPGLQLQADDLPGTSAGSYYPLALIPALAVT